MLQVGGGVQAVVALGADCAGCHHTGTTMLERAYLLCTASIGLIHVPLLLLRFLPVLSPLQALARQRM